MVNLWLVYVAMTKTKKCLYITYIEFVFEISKWETACSIDIESTSFLRHIKKYSNYNVYQHQ